ncbi:MAG: hypothetical protein M0006_06775 [Magnetospirillum sp.]|nr:hypothetical protein [Magnetospirillum sp.]
MILIRTVTLLALVAVAGPATAGSYVTLTCGDGSFDRQFMVGTGRQFRGQGLEVWPMLCTATGKFASYVRVMDSARFARLEALAARKVADKVDVKSVLDLSAELGGQDLSTLFDQTEGLTFGDIRSTVTNTAKDTGRKIGSSRYTAWSHPTCSGDLIPFDYYLDTGTPCPACGNAPLKVDTSNRAEWE